MYSLIKSELGIVLPFDSYDETNSKYYGMFYTSVYDKYYKELKILFKKLNTDGYMSYKISGDSKWHETHIHSCYDEEKDITISTLYSEDKKYRIVFLFDPKYYRGPLLKFDILIYQKE